jgi:hypothetical protein
MSGQPEPKDDIDEANERLTSGEADRSLGEIEVATDPNEHPTTGLPQCQLCRELGISSSTLERVRSIMEHSMRDRYLVKRPGLGQCMNRSK